MDPIHTHQELLLSLAGNGDPTAFYTLVAQYSNAAYIAERNKGKSHKETLSILIPFIKSAYQDFIKTSPHKIFDVWYREYKRKYFNSTSETVDIVSDADKVDFESIPIADITHFDRMLDVVLQRKYGKFKRTKRGRIIGQSRLLRRRLIVTAIGLSVVTVFVLIYVFFDKTKQRFLLTYSSPRSSITLSFPFSKNNQPGLTGSSQKNISKGENSSLEFNRNNSGIIHDTLIVHDTVRLSTKVSVTSVTREKKVLTVPSIANMNTLPQTDKPPVPPTIVNKPIVKEVPGAVKSEYDAYDSLQ